MNISKQVTKMVQSIYRSIKRFPVSIAFSIAFVVMMIVISELRAFKSVDTIENLSKVSMVLALGFALSLCIKIYFEKKGISKLYITLSALIGLVIILILYYFFLLKDFNMVSITRYIGLSLVLYISFVFIPYLKGKQNFELYVIKIFGRFFVTVIYSIVLYGGLCAILVTIDKLLEINIPSNFYYYTFLIVAGIFAPTYYLGGFPSIKDNFTKHNYPNIFKILVLYIIIPLISVYTIILYIYFIKIIVTAKWPVGLISHLVLWYSVVSAAVLFFISPLYKDNKYVNRFMKILPKAILPLIILMFFSIGIRIKAYGITENRYYVVALSLWTFAIMIYFSFTKHFKNILLPITFCIIILISILGGPISSYSVSMASQNNRLEKILKKNNMLVNNKIIKNESITELDKNEINSILKYFDNNHQLKDVKYLPENFKMKDMKNIFGFSVLEDYYSQNNFYFSVLQTIYPIDITGYDYMFDSKNMYYTGKNSTLDIKYDMSSNIFKVVNKGNIIYENNFDNIVKKLIDKYGTGKEYNTIQPEEMMFKDENSNIKIKFYILNLYGKINFSTKKINLDEISYYVLIKIK